MSVQTRRSATKALSTLAGGSLIAAAVAFLSNILTARTLGPELRGHIAFVLQASYFLAPLLIVASDRALLRSEREGSPFFIIGRRGLTVAGILALALLIIVFRDWRALAAPAGVVAGWFLLRRSEVAARGAYRRYLRPFLAFQALILVWHIALFVLGVTDWQWWVIPYAAPALLLLPIAASTSSALVRRPRANVPLLTGSLAQLWSLRGERLIMPALADPTALGLYVVVATATEPLYWVAQSLADHRVGSVPPSTTGARLRALAAVGIPFAACAALVAACLWFLLIPVFGQSFAPARALIAPLSTASLALAAYRIVNGWVLAGPRPTAVATLELSVAAVAVVAYPTGILMGGASGAAWATLVVYSTAVIIGLQPRLHLTPPQRISS